MSEYIPDADRSLFAIAEALERIADAQEALVEMARSSSGPTPSSPWYWPVQPGTGYAVSLPELPPSTTHIGIVPPATGLDGSHG